MPTIINDSQTYLPVFTPPSSVCYENDSSQKFHLRTSGGRLHVLKNRKRVAGTPEVYVSSDIVAGPTLNISI
jgi:hypothetical protein